MTQNQRLTPKQGTRNEIEDALNETEDETIKAGSNGP